MEQQLGQAYDLGYAAGRAAGLELGRQEGRIETLTEVRQTLGVWAAHKAGGAQ